MRQSGGLAELSECRDISKPGGAVRDHTAGYTSLIVTRCRTIDCLALSHLLRETPGFKVLHSTTGLDDAVEFCKSFLPDVVILDLSSKVSKAFSAADRILALEQDVSIFFLDDSLSITSLERTLALPRASYYIKDTSFDVICGGLQTAARGFTSLDPSLSGIVSYGQGLRRTIRLDGPSVLDLTRRERQVFKLLGAGCAVREIADQLGLAASTVDNHKSRLMKKLGVNKTAQIVRMAMRDRIID